MPKKNKYKCCVYSINLPWYIICIKLVIGQRCAIVIHCDSMDRGIFVDCDGITQIVDDVPYRTTRWGTGLHENEVFKMVGTKNVMVYTPRCERRSFVRVFVDKEAWAKGLRQNDTAYKILLALGYFSRFTFGPHSIKGPVAIVGLGDEEIKIAMEAITYKLYKPEQPEPPKI